MPFLNREDPEEAAAKKLVHSLTGIYVRKFTFDDDFAYPKADIDGVRRQLAAPGWSRIVEARSKKDNTNVDVFMLIDGGKAQGLAIIASEPREFTIVNIVGNIDLEQLHELEGKFGVPELADRDRQEAGARAGTGTGTKTESQNRAAQQQGHDRGHSEQQQEDGQLFHERIARARTPTYMFTAVATNHSAMNTSAAAFSAARRRNSHPTARHIARATNPMAENDGCTHRDLTTAVETRRPPNTPSANSSTVTPSAIISKTYMACGKLSAGTRSGAAGSRGPAAPRSPAAARRAKFGVD